MHPLLSAVLLWFSPQWCAAFGQAAATDCVNNMWILVQFQCSDNQNVETKNRRNSGLTLCSVEVATWVSLDVLLRRSLCPAGYLSVISFTLFDEVSGPNFTNNLLNM